MLRNVLAGILALIGVGLASPAIAQSNCSSVIFYGSVPTAAQWQSCFAAKQDNLGFTPLNIAGGTMLGPLVTTPSTNFSAGFNIQPGVPPGTPNNGDVWITSVGIFVRINGSTVGPLVSATTCSICAFINASNTFTVGPQIENLTGGTLPAGQAGTVLQLANASVTDTRAELDAYGAVPRFTGVTYGGTFASPAAVASGAEILSHNAYGYNGTSVVGPMAAIRCFANQTWSVGANGTYCDVAVTPNGSATEAETVRFENDGGVTFPSTVTGGDKGAGKLNAAGYFLNGNAVASSATAPLSLNASTGAVSITGAAGQVLAGAGATFTATPTLGVAGSIVGTLSFANLTSGSETISPATGALGSGVATLAAGTYNLVGDSLTQSLTGKTYNGLTINTTTGTFALANGKTLTANNTLTLSGTDGKALTLTNSLTVSGNDGTLSFGAASKTLSINNSLTLAGTDATTMTFPGASDTVMGIGATQTITGQKTYNKDTLIGTAGNSSTNFHPSGILCQGLTSTGNGADATPDPLQTCAVGANTLDAVGRGLHLESWGLFASNADTKTVTITWGGTVIYTSTGLTSSGTNWYVWCNVMKTGSSTQTASCTGHFGNSVPSTNVNATTITDTSAQNLITTGQSGSSAANDVVSKGQIVSILN